MLQSKLKTYGKGIRLLTADDEYLVKFIEKVKLPVYFFLIFDVIFYTIHTISHQSMTIKQTTDSAISICLAIILLCLLSFDTASLAVGVVNLKRPTKRKLIEQLLVKNIQAARRAKPNKSVAEIIKMFKKKHLYTMNKIFVDFESKLSFRPAVDRFVHGGIKISAVETCRVARFFNLVTVMKTMAMEILFISMQANNSLQISMLLLIQTSFIVYFIYCTVVKIFKNKWQVAITMLYEGCLLGYFVLTFIIHMSHDPIRQLSSSSSLLQTVVVSCLTVSMFCGMTIVCTAFVHTAIVTIRQKRSKESIQADDENNMILNELTDKLAVVGYIESMIGGRKEKPHGKDESNLLDVSSYPLMRK